MRLVFVLQDLEFGGTQRQVLHLASRLDRRRFPVELWVLRSGGGFTDEALESDVPVHFLSRSQEVGPASLYQLWRQLRTTRPDCVVPFTAVSNIWCRVFGRMLALPLVVGTCRGGGALSKQWERYLWKFARHHICNARFLKEGLVAMGVEPGRITVIENGLVSLEQTADAPAQKGATILSVGRLVEDKDHRTLIRAFARVAAQSDDARLVLVGDGPLLGDLTKLATSLGVADRVVFRPGQVNLADLYAACDVFALSSVREASPNVVMEAAGAGRPVVATNVGGIPELVKDGVTGLLVPADDPAAMADGLVRLLDDAQLRREWGRAARVHVEQRFGMERMVGRYEAVLAALLDRE